LVSDERPTAVVTGARRGIGRVIARTLAARGHVVACLDLEPSDETVAEIGGDAAASYVCDVADEDSVARTFAAVASELGGVDVLVNNAGLYTGLERRPFWELEPAEWRRVLAVNVDSVFLCTRAALPSMRRRGRGRVVNIASNVIAFGMADLMHYVASKAAVVGITRSMARELGPFGITANAVAPGLVTTEVTAELIPEAYRRQVADEQCVREPVEPQDVAGAVAYLASAEARLVTGQTLHVAGGATMSAI
jgi:3-oxoacyl-[acyl-carrier protein] reductase